MDGYNHRYEHGQRQGNHETAGERSCTSRTNNCVYFIQFYYNYKNTRKLDPYEIYMLQVIIFLI